jgi:hypothetical protein
VPITPLELAFVIDDPCGQEQIALARTVLELISNRPDHAQCIAIRSELRALHFKYPRLSPEPTLIDASPWHQESTQ